VARELVTAFANALKSAEERHLRRLAKVQAMEDRYTGKTQKTTGLPPGPHH
jgi:hypothetical protein